MNSELTPALNFIAGCWREAADGARFAVTDPADGRRFADVPDSTPVDACAAVDAASTAFPAWSLRPARERAVLLLRWHAAIVANEAELGALISREQGKPLREARGEIAYAASYVEWFAAEAERIRGDVIEPAVNGRRMLALKEPVGVVAAITPWNFPAAMIARKIAPALAAGCTVVAKPAEDTPLTSLALVRLAEQVGFPTGVLNVVCASRERTPAVVDAWLMDARVRKISFTGSTPVGRHLARESAATLKRLSLELGGNAPFIVFEDADLDAAVQGLMDAKFRNGGQTCVCPNRVFVHDAVADAFAARLAARVGTLRVGPAREADTDIGPMINARAVDKILRHIGDAVARGARLVVGGEQVRRDLGPHYVAPTVLADVPPGAALCDEETFGPVVALFRFRDEDEVVRVANDTPFGLAAYFYSQDVRRIWRVTGALQTGIVGVNEGVLAAAAAPFGGVKESGYGREGSVHGLDDYMHIKYVCQGNLA